jgi:membrane protein
VIKLQRIILTKGPIGALLKKTKHLHLPGFAGIPLYDVLKFFYRQVKTHGLQERASAVSYNFIMAIPPSLLFLFTLIPHLPFISNQSIKQQLHTFIYDIIPAKTYNAELIKLVDNFMDNTQFGLLSIGLMLSLFFSSNAMMGLMRSFNKKRKTGFQRRLGIHQRWIAIKLIVIIFGLLIAYLLLLISQGAILKWLVKSEFWINVIAYTRWILIILLIYFIIGFIYRHAPAVHKRWKFNTPGTILATFLSMLSTLGFSLYFDNFGKFNAVYGSIGSIMLVMVIIYVNSLSLLIGFELNVSIHSLKAIAENREERESAEAANPSHS